MEKQILSLFLTNKKLKFNEIEKFLNVRSNKLDYHLKKLINKKILEKEKEFYSLSETSEYLIPYLSEKKSVLPVILIHIGDDKETFLYKREKRPYKNLLSLPGGRVIICETLKDSVRRIMKEKHKINASIQKIHSVSMEHVKKNNKIIHSFLLIFVSAKTKNKIELTNLSKNKSRIIASDYKLIKENLNSQIEIKTIFSNL